MGAHHVDEVMLVSTRFINIPEAFAGQLFYRTVVSGGLIANDDIHIVLSLLIPMVADSKSSRSRRGKS